MNITEAAYHIKYAVATYSWPYYLYMHNVRGFCDLCCTFNSANNFPTANSLALASTSTVIFRRFQQMGKSFASMKS